MTKHGDDIRKLKVEMVDIDQIEPYEYNARTHPPEQIDQIVDSIRRFGWTNPVLIDENNRLIAGHGRLEAAHVLNFTKVPAIASLA
jgi:ParB family chromosome partitioning protein